MPSNHYPLVAIKCHQTTDNFEVCSNCRKSSPLKHVWIGTEYDGLAKDLIHVYKFGHARAASRILAENMKTKLPYLPEVIVVPVPTATNRVRERGFDHAGLLAKELSKQTGQKYISALSRQGQTRQVGTKRSQRQKQMTDAFLVRYGEVMKGAHILLVDDVVTTGATLEEAARVIRSAGAKKIDAIVFAQKQ